MQTHHSPLKQLSKSDSTWLVSLNQAKGALNGRTTLDRVLSSKHSHMEYKTSRLSKFRNNIAGLTLIMAATMLLSVPSLASASNCSVTTSGAFAFTNYDPFSSTPDNLSAPNFINLTCKGNGSATVNLSAGNSGSYFPRIMTNGPNQLTYNLYTTPALTTVWGDGTGKTVNVTEPFQGNFSVSLSLYGQIPAQQNVIAGNYADTIVITVNY